MKQMTHLERGTPTKLIGLRVPVDVYDALKSRAAREMSSIQQVVRTAIARDLRRDQALDESPDTNSARTVRFTRHAQH